MAAADVDRTVRIFVTGAAGFLGSNYVRHVLDETDHRVTIYDALTYAGNLASIRDVLDDARVDFVHADICEVDHVAVAMDGHDAVVSRSERKPRSIRLMVGDHCQIDVE